MKLNSFHKWLSSSKFQIALIAIGLIYLSMQMFKSNPDTAIPAIRDVALGYFGARVVEPVVEFAINKLGKGNKVMNKATSEELEGDE